MPYVCESIVRDCSEPRLQAEPFRTRRVCTGLRCASPPSSSAQSYQLAAQSRQPQSLGCLRVLALPVSRRTLSGYSSSTASWPERSISATAAGQAQAFYVRFPCAAENFAHTQQASFRCGVWPLPVLLNFAGLCVTALKRICF